MDAPACSVKAFISQLWDDTRGNDQKKTFLKGLDISNTLIWIQGVIVDYRDREKTLVVDDGTGVIAVGCVEGQRDCEMPGGVKHNFQKGNYVICVGTVICTIPRPDHAMDVISNANADGSGLHGFGHVALEAMDTSGVLFLGGDPNMETLWFTEVMQAQRSWA